MGTVRRRKALVELRGELLLPVGKLILHFVHRLQLDIDITQVRSAFSNVICVEPVFFGAVHLLDFNIALRFLFLQRLDSLFVLLFNLLLRILLLLLFASQSKSQDPTQLCKSRLNLLIPLHLLILRQLRLPLGALPH